jgi:hypothetical protein
VLDRSWKPQHRRKMAPDSLWHRRKMEAVAAGRVGARASKEIDMAEFCILIGSELTMGIESSKERSMTDLFYILWCAYQCLDLINTQ